MTNYTVEFRAMGCQIRVWLGVSRANKGRILQEVRGWFEYWESILSRFRSTSELSYLNSRSGRWTEVSPTLLDVITAAVNAARLTSGLVNPLILPALEAAGYKHSFDPETFVPANPSPRTGVPDWRAIEIDRKNSRVLLPRHARMDLGGIGKGWAAAQAADQLSQIGPCLVDAGGDMVAHGAPDDSGGWLVTVPTSSTDDASVTVSLRNAAIATSGIDYRRWTRNGHTQHHLIDPRTGRPALTDVLTATVVAEDMIEAEAWAKAAIIGGRLPSIPAFLIHQDGSASCNSQFETLRRNSQC